MSEQQLEQRDTGVTTEQIAANLRAWIHDLRTTDAKQGSGALRSVYDEYCCLGRACVTLGIEWLPPRAFSSRYTIGAERVGGLLPDHVRESVGLSEEEHRACWRMNDDDGKSFREIADWLEVNILPRYAPEPAAS